MYRHELKTCFSQSSLNNCIHCLKLHLKYIDKLPKLKYYITPKESTLSLSIKYIISEYNNIPIAKKFKLIRYIVNIGFTLSENIFNVEFTYKQLRWLINKGLIINQQNINDCIIFYKWKHVEIIRNISMKQNRTYIVKICNIMLYIRNLINNDYIMTIMFHIFQFLKILIPIL